MVREKVKIEIDKNNMMFIEITEADLSGDYVLEIMRQAVEKAKQIPGKVKILVNFPKPALKIGNSKLRKEIKNLLLKAYKEVDFKKVAICVSNTLLRMACFFVVKASGLDNVKTFDTKGKALIWLKKP